MRILAALVSAFCAALSSLAADPVDLATYWETPPTAKPTLAAGDYTLSADYTLPVALGAKAGSTFDFSEGGHTFGVTGDLQLLNPYVDRTTTFKGGAWNLTGAVITDYSGTSFSNDKLVFDNTSFTATRVFFVSANAGGDVLFALTNGATLNVTSTEYSEFCRARPAGGDPFVFDISTGSKLTMKGGFNFVYSGGAGGDVWQNCTLRVRGAGSSFGNTSAVCIGQFLPGYTLEVSDGASFSSSRLNIGAGGYAHDNTVIVRGAGTSLSSTYPKIGEQSAPKSSYFGATTNNWVYVLDGATATLSTAYQESFPIGPYSPFNGVYVSNATLNVDAFYLGASSAAGSNNVFWITGPSTTVAPTLSWCNNGGTTYRPFGAGQNCAIRVEDGATLNLGNGWYGAQFYGTNCLVRVAGKNATANKAAHLTLSGSYSLYLTGKNSRIEVLDGGKLTCSTLVNSYTTTRHGCGNTVIVSNATASISKVMLGTDSTAASNNVFVATGPDTSLSGIAGNTNPYRPFGAGPNCELRFEDGVQLTTSVDYSFSGTNCLFRVSGTNEVAQKQTKLLDLRNLTFPGKGNTFEVSDGAYLYCYCCYVGYGGGAGGTENTILVSNGTFNVGQYHGLYLKGASNRLVLKGDHPRVYGPSNLYLWDGAKLVFELPLGKTYDAANPPIGFGSYITVDWDGYGGADPAGSGADPEILFPNLMEYRKSIEKTVTLQLAKTHTDTRMKRVIQETNAKLPRGCKLKADSANNVTLTVRPYRGTSIVIR